MDMFYYMEASQVMGVPPNHPFVHRIFHEINHPAIGYPHDYGNYHLLITIRAY